MQDLTVIENELVPVYETSTGEKVVYGTELYTVLEVKSKFADWVKNRLNDCEAIEHEDFQTFSKNLEKGRPTIDYIIKLDTAKEMAMLERNEKGKQVRRYFIQVEKKYKQNVKPLSAIDQIRLQNEALLEVNEKVDGVQERVDYLENTMNIDHAQKKEIKGLANEVVISSLGGKDAPAYRHKDVDGKMISRCAFSQFWNDFKGYFDINSYENLPRVKMDEARQYINKWQPPTNMQLEIGRINRRGMVK